MDDQTKSEMDYSLVSKRVFKDKLDDDIYVTNIDVSKESSNPWLASALSNGKIEIISIDTFKTVCTAGQKAAKIYPTSSVKFSSQNSNYLYYSSEEGCITLCDLRQSNSVVAKVFKDPEISKVKPINCFDISDDERFVVGGTDLVGSEAYLLFWDCRSSKILGGYWESHTDDILEVGYHPTKQHILMSGSTDGLINIFDLTQSSEDEALLNTLNTEKTVSKAKWLKEDHISCITHNEEIQVWDSEEVERLRSYSREQISENNQTEVDYFIDILLPTNSSSETTIGFLASGTNNGSSHVWNLIKPENETNAYVKLWTSLKDGHRDVIRCISSIGNNFVTGGEDGALCLWKPDEISSDLKIKSLMKGNLHLHNKKPY